MAECEYLFDKTCPTLRTFINSDSFRVFVSGEQLKIGEENKEAFNLFYKLVEKDGKDESPGIYNVIKNYCKGNYLNCPTYKFIKKNERLDSKLDSISV